MSPSSAAAALQSILTAVEPAARVVPARALRRAIRMSRDWRDLEPRPVHDRGWWVERDHLIQFLSPAELGLSPDDPAAELLLIPAPPDGSAPPTALHVWRTLFHGALDRELNRAFSDGRLDPETVRALRHHLGPARWHAARVVLREENLIDEADADTDVFREWCSFALEVAEFAPAKWHAFFPGLSLDDEPLRTARRVIDVERIKSATRPALAESPPAPSSEGMQGAATDGPVRVSLTDAGQRRLDKWQAQGNDLGATILYQKVGDSVAASDALRRLVGRLRRLLDFSEHESGAWESALARLLPAAAAGGWPVERRLLYELQRACLAVERQSYAIGLSEWALTLGRRPMKRPLSKPKWPDATRRLRAAARHADRLPVGPAREALTHLLEHAALVADRKARDDLRPEIATVLNEVGLVPQSVAEQRSRDKLVEELLDAACARGFLRIGDLRDAIARNRLKLPDLSGPGELIRGDPLIRANRKLAVRLDGVYRRGEVYMRLLQRGCSVFFGTRPGRLLTRFVALPFGGAFLILEAIHHMIEAGEGLVNWLSGWSATVDAFPALAGSAAGHIAAHPHPDVGANWTMVIALGVVLLLLIHSHGFRRQVVRGVQFLFVKLPRAVRRSPVVQFLVHSRITRFVRRYLIFPALFGGLTAALCWLAGADWTSISLVGGGSAVLAGTFFRTPFGRALEDRLNEQAERVWRIISVNLVLGALALILHFFQAVFEAIDRGIYAVDEWLRFQEGESRFTFAFKLLFGAVWSVVTYLFRFAWTLLVEPQVNPIKHFPVVTVSHKLLLPLIPSLAKSFGTSQETMGTIVFGIPGIFGFLVWELKENWKLYRANAPTAIRPAVVGSHGERVRALLRPGFHSGVVPKTFAKWRRALRSGNETRGARHRHSLEHIAEAVQRFADRDFAAYLRGSRRWGRRPIRAGHPILTPNRLLVPLDVGEDAPVVICLEERGGWVIASVEKPGPLGEWSAARRAAFADALAGLYKFAGVHAVREQTARILGESAHQFDAVPEGLLVRRADGTTEFYDYDDGPELHSPERELPSTVLVYSDCPVAWTDWVERWEADAAGKSPAGPLVPGWWLLPGPAPPSAPGDDDQPAGRHADGI